MCDCNDCKESLLMFIPLLPICFFLLFFCSYGWGKKWGGGCREGEGRENAKHPCLDYH